MKDLNKDMQYKIIKTDDFYQEIETCKLNKIETGDEMQMTILENLLQ